jgi:tetratricopeptide (TPR) repeat protein
VNERKLKFNILIFILLSLVSSAAIAESPRSLVDKGNAFYEDGKFEEAVAEYDKAISLAPNATEPKFNKAKCKVKTDDIDGAIDLFKEVAVSTKGSELVARAKFNLGNAFFKRSESGHEGDIKKVVEDLKTAISFWRQVLDIEPENLNAAKNIEAAIMRLQIIRYVMEKQKELSEKIAKLREDLEKLLAEQQRLSGDNKTVQAKAEKRELTQPQAATSYKNQSPVQSKVSRGTGKAQSDSVEARELEKHIESFTKPPADQQPPQDPQQGLQAAQPEQQSALEFVKDELAQAISAQSRAVNNLNEGVNAAIAEQDTAAEHIEKAIEALKQKQEEDQQQEQQDQQDQGQQDEQNQDQQQNEEQQEQKDQQDEQDQQEQEQQDEEEKQAQAAKATAEEILKKEKQDRQKRQIFQLGRKKVEKDW